ncbi:putative DNA binding domain-containing protein [Corynebacterium uterequi]|uniref:Schlafen AlbA-2 domain-containing protein n=1 Tax=Corynebacterium uterequi TaxID=1072256 RepID=A0A0G3HFG7_9CORY|nr:hypothetical protein [Corynebacterium uterequi]AKK12096.1 hypothetical protein CUTER_10660 [Corynebacterium uterequi]
MNWDRLSSSEPIADMVARLRRQGDDDSTVEAKSVLTKLSASVWVTVSAFANTNGSYVLLGLE